MALNPYFTQGTRGEQSLVQDLINEQLRTYGVDVHYIPRKYLTSNTVIKEVIQSKFDDAYPIEAYVKSDSYEGAGILMSKFGVQQQDDVTLIISRERWETYIQPLIQNEQDIKLSSRPKGGDLIYFPLDDRLYEIKFVEYADPFYQLQDLYTYELRCEVFRYEDEVIDTGIGDIDDSMEDAGYAETLKLIGIGQTATVSTSVVDGALKFISLTNQGQGYTSIPTVAISSAPGGIQATAVAIMTSRTGFATASSIDRVLMINPGAGYTVPPTVVFVGGGGSGAIATVGLATTGAVGIITVSNGGSGYSTPPTVTIDTPTHVGASATAVIDHPIGAGVSVLSAPIGIGAANFLFPVETTGGRFYSRTPQVTFALPTGGSNTASATATMGDFDSTGGTVASIAVNGEGKFYDQANPPTVTISAPGFSRATATIGLSGTSINPNSVAFTTTGRGYSSTPTVSIGLGTGLSTGQTAIGIATINIAGVVTAVSFNESDSWAVGTGATIGFGYTLTPTITFGSPSPVNATATPTVSVAGTITAISIGNSGFGYAPGTTATISISSPGGANEAFRALGVATMRFDSVKTEGTIGIGSTFITGITTTGILLGDRVRLQYDYDNTLTNYILDGTHVTQIDPNIVYMSAAATNTGIGTTSIEFGINGCGIVTGIAVTFGGGGYIEPPVISIANSAADKNYSSLEVGVNTATAEAILNSSGEISAIRISDSGDKYTLGTNNLPPQISFSSPSLVGSGDYTYNEIVTDGTTGTKARVKKWISSTKELRVSIANGTFTSGETITGQDSGAVYTLSTVDTDDLIDAYADNDNIQTEADGILDFTQRNPFGEV